MNKTEVLKLIKANKNDRGIANWKKYGFDKSGLKSFGIGLTQLRKLGKQIGRDQDLALQLWASNVYDAKVIAPLIDDPKAMTRAQAERQVEEVEHAQLSHVFSSCDATPDEACFLDRVHHIGNTFDQEIRHVKGSMGGALMGIGKRSAKLKKAALHVARSIGPIEFDTPSGDCEPFDVAKHLTSDYIRQKLGV